MCSTKVWTFEDHNYSNTRMILVFHNTIIIFFLLPVYSRCTLNSTKKKKKPSFSWTISKIKWYTCSVSYWRCLTELKASHFTHHVFFNNFFFRDTFLSMHILTTISKMLRNRRAIRLICTNLSIHTSMTLQCNESRFQHLTKLWWVLNWICLREERNSFFFSWTELKLQFKFRFIYLFLFFCQKIFSFLKEFLHLNINWKYSVFAHWRKKIPRNRAKNWTIFSQNLFANHLDFWPVHECTLLLSFFLEEIMHQICENRFLI